MLSMAAVLGTGACSTVVGADFGQAHPRSKANDSLPLLAEMRAPMRTQTWAQFGAGLAVDSTGVALSAPYQDVATVSGLMVHGGASYLFDRKDPSTPRSALVAPNVGADDGNIPKALVPKGSEQLGDHGDLAMALSDELVVVGVPGEGSAATQQPQDNGPPKSGAVYVYSRVSGGPLQYFKAPKPEAGALFGASVALSGSRLAVAAPLEDTDTTDSGAVYVYEWKGTQFDDGNPVRIPRSVAHEGDAFGTSVAMDGDLLAVGAFGESSGGTGFEADPTDTSILEDGAAYVYRLIDGHWSPELYVKPGYARAVDYYGWSVALSDGRLAVGAPKASNCPDDRTFSREGVVYVYGDSSGASPGAGQWSLEACLSVAGAHNLFGWSVALLGDQLVAGAPWNLSGRSGDPTDQSGPYSGAAFLYVRGAAGDWAQRAFIKAPDLEANDIFGEAVGIAPGVIAVSAPWAAGMPHGMTDASHYSGAAYLFSTAGL